MNVPGKQTYRHGFTLVEVMLAITLLAVLIAAVSATWSAALSAWKRSASVTETFQRERIVLGALSEMTESLLYSRSADGMYAVRGEHRDTGGDEVSFVTASDVFLPPREAVLAGLRRVTLSLEQDSYGRVYLGLRNEPALPATETGTTEAGPSRVLSADVSGFTVRYRHPQSGAWQDQWEEVNLVPGALEFTVTFGGADARTPAITVVRQVEVPVAVALLKGAGETSTSGMRLPPRVLTREAPGQ
jgi:prepilin-type N-terminal cleavage/methylation domain-containing protein